MLSLSLFVKTKFSSQIIYNLINIGMCLCLNIKIMVGLGNIVKVGFTIVWQSFLAVATVVGFFGDWDDFFSENKSLLGRIASVIIPAFSKPLFWVVISLLIIGIVFCFFFRRSLVAKGANHIPLSCRVFLRRLNPKLIRKLAQYTHEFQHLMDDCKDKIIRRKYSHVNVWQSDGKALTAKLVKKIQEIIELVIGEPVAVHIKMFRKQGEQSGSQNIRDVELETYIRVPSRWEIAQNDANDLAERAHNEKFKIFHGLSSQDLRDGIEKGSFGEHKVNSAYNYVFGANSHFWVSNNLIKDEESEIFISTSRNWKKYYKSLAVFLISPPVPSRVEVDSLQPKGLLIVDSPKTGLFERKFIGNLIGYFCHRLHNYFELYGEKNE